MPYISYNHKIPKIRYYIFRNYIPANVLPLGLEIYGSRIWVTIPSWRKGVPATLATVSRSGGVTSPKLKPYPDWSFHRAFSEYLYIKIFYKKANYNR